FRRERKSGAPAPDCFAWSEPPWLAWGHCAAKLPRGQTIAALEQAVEMRDIAETGGKSDFGDGLVTRVAIEQIARARNNPLLVDVLAHRAVGCRKQAVHIAFGAAESRSQCCCAELRIVAVTIDMVKHHRQQHGD